MVKLDVKYVFLLDANRSHMSITVRLFYISCHLAQISDPAVPTLTTRAIVFKLSSLLARVRTVFQLHQK